MWTVPKTLTHLLRIHYQGYRRRQSIANTKASDSVPPASKVWDRFRTLWNGSLNWLKLALDTSRPDQILVSCTPFQQKLVGDGHNITLKDIDPILSILAATYKLAKAYPSRFCQQQSLQPSEHTWGLHHEDWMRAYAVITFACENHFSFASSFEQNHNAAMFGTYMDLAQKTQQSESFGYITDELLRQVETPKRPNWMTAMQQDQEIDFPELEEDLSRLATKDEIKHATDTLGLFQSKTAAERDRIIQDTNGAWSEIITDAVCATLGTIVPGTDLDEELSSLQVPTKMRRSPITESERRALRALLKSRVKANEHISSNRNIDLERLIKARVQVGENPSPNQDLSSICSLRGIDVNTLSVDPYNSTIKARAPHIIGMLFSQPSTNIFWPRLLTLEVDANRLAELLGGPLRTAILHSECGTGNTSVALLALKFLVDERIHTFDNGMLHIEEADRVFKPSIIFVPSGTLRSHFTLMRSCWMGMFHISLLCEASESWMNQDGKSNVVNNITELQKHIDRWAAEHGDSKTARTILLASYEAGAKYMLGAQTGQPHFNQEIRGQVTREHRGTDMAPDQKFPTDLGNSIDENGPEQEVTTQTYCEKMVIQNDMWNAVILVECHSIDDETTSHHSLVKQLDQDALLLVSSSLLWNLTDLLGDLRLMWDTVWPFSYSVESGSTSNMAIYNPETYEQLLRRESTHEAIRKRVIAGGVAPDTLTPRQRQRRAEYIKFILEGSGPAYYLHPELLKDIWQANGRVARAILPMIKKVLEMVSVQRGLLTPMSLPSGDTTYFGVEVAGLTIRTIELTSRHSDSIRKRLHSHISELMKCSEDLDAETGKVEAMLDSAICRRLSLISTDVNNIALTTPTKGLLNLVSTRQGSSTPCIPTKESEFTNRLTKFDTTGGLEWLFYHTRELQRYSFPKDRLGQVRFTAWDSPKYCHVLLRALEAKERHEKLLVCVNNLLTSQ